MDHALKTLKALADPTRLRVVALLVRRPLCVCELMFVLGKEQTLLSHQLGVLRKAGLVEDSREGRFINYRVPDASRRGLERLLSEFLGLRPKSSKEMADDLARLKLCLERDVRGGKCPLPGRPRRKT
ncbi:MAG: winged helix-turn-helix transcriptional regulator [Candidatus Aminicenantes bacterium]|nr:winged helix-turn-helix transcriptional regulator [Candidatus Aminicenantes bacterium]